MLSAQPLLESVQKNLAALGRYSVTFEATMEGYATKGEYVVDGNNFYVSLEGVELYVADGVKYEVNVAGKEVVVDSVQSLGSDLLSNPAHFFANLAEQYNSTAYQQQGLPYIKLTPKQGGGEQITIAVDRLTKLPKTISYAMGEQSLVISLLNIVTAKEPLPQFDSDKYVGYEIVDMRL